MNFESWFQSQHAAIPVDRALRVLKLHEEGATIPFIARYRKEQTGNLDEVAIQQTIEAKELWDDLIQRKEFILKEIESQGKLTPELRSQIENTYKIDTLEDLYLPYKKKKKTKATLAKEAGLLPLAEWLWNTGHGTEPYGPEDTLEAKAQGFINAEAGINEVQTALDGAQHILIERLAESAELRQLVREELFTRGCIRTKKGERAKQNSKFENYFDFHEKVDSLLKPQSSHRYLALRRGESEGELIVTIEGAPDDALFEERLIQSFETAACTDRNAPGAQLLVRAAKYAYKYYVKYSIDAEVHGALKDAADEVAIKVFAENVRTVLMSSPFGSKAVLGVDPGVRTGCKLALVDDSGKFLESAVVHPENFAERPQTLELLRTLATKVELKAIAVGNGTAGRETESFFREVIAELGLSVPVVMVSESGASVYSASEAAREEFPELDLTIRGAISIARRLQDPLAELVKIDPKSIGVGQYQHDVSPTALKKSLERVVESCVNSVGVNLNTASEHLLAYVSGIGPTLARSIVEYRTSRGLFKSRQDLMEVTRFGDKAFEQAAGFLRIPGAENALDNTGIHPEQYPVLQSYASQKGLSVEKLIGDGISLLKEDRTLIAQIGEFTFQDIVEELEKPGRDPREVFIPFSFLEGIKGLADLKAGMKCPGIVTNVTNFGAFVDIGVHQDGLVHISQLSDKFIKDPREVVSPGQRVTVSVLEVNLEKKQISLTMKQEGASSGERPRYEHKPREQQPREQRASQPRREPREGAPQQSREHHSGQRDQKRKPDQRQQRPQQEDTPLTQNPFASLGNMMRK